ncbi:MAG: sulfatase-like hydrolase/transferase, partial [Planctomycetes bacterium]|nr:sulfatase-like hydrolase/transferase [Planctomycetota bacterium]
MIMGGALIVCAGLVQRGRYLELRAAVTALAALLLVAGLSRVGRKLPTWLVRFLAGLGLAGALFGSWSARRDDAAADWAQSRGTASTLVFLSLRSWLVPDPAAFVPTITLADPFDADTMSRLDQRLESLPRRPRGILFVTIDGWRGDLLGQEVGGLAVSPRLEARVADGLVFENAYAPSPGTCFSFLGFLSGLPPSRWIQRDGGLADWPLITERLRRAGVRTRACFPQGGLTLGPELLSRRDLGFELTSGHHWEDPPLAAVTRLLSPTTANERWFSFWHVMLPHHPYDEARPEFRAGDSDFEQYAAEIRQADAMVMDLVAHLEAAGHLDDAWVFVAADHGEEFGEHGSSQHGTQLYDESVRVPLLAFGPGIVTGRHVPPVTLTGLATLLEQVFDLPEDGRPPGMARSFLAPLLGEQDTLDPKVVLIENPPLGLGAWNTRSAVVSETHKLIEDERSRRTRLFDRRNDPKELHDRSREEPQQVAALRGWMAALRSDGRSRTERPYRDLSTWEEMFLDAENEGPDAVLAQLRLARDLPEALRQRYLLWFADRRVSGYLESLLDLGRPSPAIETLLRADAGKAIDTEIQTALTDLPGWSDPELVAAWF